MVSSWDRLTATATSDGVIFDLGADTWSLPAPGGSVRFDFLSLVGASVSLRTHAKQAIAASLTTRPTRSVHGDFESIRGLFRCLAELRPETVFIEITPDLLLAHEAILPPKKRYLASRVTIALRRWAAAGVGGLGPNLAAWLSWVPTEAHDAGQAVRTCSTTQGAHSPVERDAMLAALHASHDAGTVGPTDYALALLIIVLALRPVQVAWLKAGDLQPASNPAKFAANLLVPRAKQRNGRQPRQEFTVRGIIPALADVLRKQCAVATGPEASMFPAGRSAGPAVPGFEGHLSSTAVGARYKATLARIGRAGGSPLRSRRTFATTLSIEGCSLPEISALLDHTGPDMARAYIEASPALVPLLGRTAGPRFTALACKFGARRADL